MKDKKMLLSLQSSKSCVNVNSYLLHELLGVYWAPTLASACLLKDVTMVLNSKGGGLMLSDL